MKVEPHMLSSSSCSKEKAKNYHLVQLQRVIIMRAALVPLALAALFAHDTRAQCQQPYYVSLGPRPYYIINNMTQSYLSCGLEHCENGPFSVTSFTIGHRGGGTLQFPEETVESTMAGARMGTGILECDVSFTADRGLVCRHSLCDLHTTTNILLKPELAKKCTTPFQPANGTSPATALCCTSDITIAEYQTLCGKQDGFNASAKTPKDYQYGTPTWRTELYDTCGTVMTLDSYITLVDSLPGNRNFTPELKTPPPQVPMPFHGYTQEQYARDMIEKFIQRGISPDRVWPQSFNPPDIFQWLKEYHAFGKNAIYLDESGDTPDNYTAAIARLPSIKAQGVNIISPPFPYLLTLGGPNNTTIVPSSYAMAAKAAGLDIITWTFERSGPLAGVAADMDYYYMSISSATKTDGQLYEILDVLGSQIGIKAIFTDWAATVTYYANCFGFKGPVASDYK
jgi:glycerophosphoryl diester phosphodiesterase